jgi:hypothetical protein
VKRPEGRQGRRAAGGWAAHSPERGLRILACLIARRLTASGSTGIAAALDIDRSEAPADSELRTNLEHEEADDSVLSTSRQVP